jgi:hypothetical protein
MDTQKNKIKQKNIWTLIAGLAFVAIGGYRIYNHLYVDSVDYGNFRLILAAVFIAYGAYSIYNYLKAE